MAGRVTLGDYDPRPKNALPTPLVLRFAALFLLTLLCSSAAHADFLDYHFEMRCDKAGNRVEIKPYAINNKRVHNTRAQDCTLASGRTVRARIGLGPVFPYGSGGANPSIWISVWVDKALVLSRSGLVCDTEGPCNERILVTAHRTELCELERPEPGDGASPEEVCETVPEGKLSKAGHRDSIEYPATGEPVRPAAGSLATLYARDAAFCRAFSIDTAWKAYRPDTAMLKLPPGAQRVQATRTLHEHWAATYKRYDFDINNDGKDDIVVALHTTTSYRDADVYYALNERTATYINTLAREENRSYAFARVADRIVPHAWATGAEQRLAAADKDDAQFKVQGAGAPWWNLADEPVFGLRGLHVLPFRYNGSTYFVANGTGAMSHWFTIVRPAPDYKPMEMCVFQVAEPRY